MSKLKTKLAGFFFNLAKKIDKDEVIDKYLIPTQPVTFINYDTYHVDKLHIQHAISNEFNYMNDGYKEFMEARIPEMLTRGLAEEIMKVHKDEIKKEEIWGANGLSPQTIYSLDVYMCKPTRKESL